MPPKNARPEFVVNVGDRSRYIGLLTPESINETVGTFMGLVAADPRSVQRVLSDFHTDYDLFVAAGYLPAELPESGRASLRHKVIMATCGLLGIRYSDYGAFDTDTQTAIQREVPAEMPDDDMALLALKVFVKRSAEYRP